LASALQPQTPVGVPLRLRAEAEQDEARQDQDRPADLLAQQMFAGHQQAAERGVVSRTATWLGRGGLAEFGYFG
jgi:hypothetical protein